LIFVNNIIIIRMELLFKDRDGLMDHPKILTYLE